MPPPTDRNSWKMAASQGAFYVAFADRSGVNRPGSCHGKAEPASTSNVSRRSKATLNTSEMTSSPRDSPNRLITNRRTGSM